MSKKRLNGDDITYENQGGVLVIDIKNDGRTLRIIFEDSFTYMLGLLYGSEVINTQIVDVEDLMDELEPEKGTSND